MDASQRWTPVTGFPAALDGRFELFWGEFHTDDAGPGGDRRDLIRLLRDPIEALAELIPEIDDSWQVHSSFANHGFGLYWQRCMLVLMVSREERSVAIHAWKVRPPTKQPPGWDDAEAQD
jgi:hypothetical protein